MAERGGTEVQFINHSSLLIQSSGHFVLTDPWHETPAFGCWLSVPPTCIHPVYLTALARTIGSRFSILISHGHDDHLDDAFLSTFPKATRIVIPQYASKGLASRVRQIGFENVAQIDPTAELEVGSFKFSTYLNLDASRDDAIVAIETSDGLIVHANDNWREMTPESLLKLRDLVRNKGAERVAYFSQCNIADGYPYIYPQFSKDEKDTISTNRIARMTQASLANALNIGAGNFVNYAGHTKSFVKFNPSLTEATGYKSYDFIRAQLSEMGGGPLKILDLVPGDSFDFLNVHKMFHGVRLDDEVLKQESVNYYVSQGVVDKCASFQASESATSNRFKRLEGFLLGFYEFVNQRADSTGFRPDVKKQNLAITDSLSGETLNIHIGSGQLLPQPSEPFTRLTVTPELMERLLNGGLNLEVLTIGGACLIEKAPADHYNGDIQFWLSMYAYFYQRQVNSRETKVLFQASRVSEGV